ncbi:hypothetical protein [Lacinutrix chionoecetis]
MIKAFKIGLIATVIIYVCGLSFSYYTNNKFNSQFQQLDRDKNGVLNGDEKTKASSLFIKQMETRKTTKQAMIVLIPVSLIIGLFVFGMTILFSKIKRINDNEIDYRKQQ